MDADSGECMDPECTAMLKRLSYHPAYVDRLCLGRAARPRAEWLSRAQATSGPAKDSMSRQDIADYLGLTIETVR